jgi:ABC-type Mn2+/Zn2+ transport system permease subunit
MAAKQRPKEGAGSRRQRYVLVGAALGLYFGYFFRPVREPDILSSVLLVAGLSLLAALVVTLLRWRRADNQETGSILRYGLGMWLTFALFLVMQEGRHYANALGGRLATMIFTTIAGAALGWWYWYTAEKESR